MAFPPPRPQGTAPFSFMTEMSHLYLTMIEETDVELVTRKYDGFFVRIDKAAGLHIYSRNGIKCLPTSQGALGVIGRVFRAQFSHLDPHKVVHPKYGRAGALFGEIFVKRNDQVAIESAKENVYHLEDLQALMHKTDLEGRSFELRLFWCSFSCDDPAQAARPVITWAERLVLCKEAFGLESIVEVFLDTSKLLVGGDVGISFPSMETCYRYGEGLVYQKKDGKFYKDKAIRPVDMLLVAVGITRVQSHRVPTHFFWGVRDPSAPGTFAVPLVEDMGYLFDAKREASGKIRLSTEYVVYRNGSYSYQGGRPNYFGKVLNAHLDMVYGELLIQAKSVERHKIVLNDGRKLIIGPNRSASFKGFEKLLFPATPQRGVVGFNQVWMTGEKNSVAGLHFQAPKLVATEDYGHEIYRILLDRPQPVSAETLVKIATTMTRDLYAHATEVYGTEAPHLIYGTEYEKTESSCAYKSHPSSQGDCVASDRDDIESEEDDAQVTGNTNESEEDDESMAPYWKHQRV